MRAVVCEQVPAGLKPKKSPLHATCTRLPQSPVYSTSEVSAELNGSPSQVSSVSRPFAGATKRYQRSGVVSVHSRVPSAHCVSTGMLVLAVGKVEVNVNVTAVPTVSGTACAHSSCA